MGILDVLKNTHIISILEYVLVLRGQHSSISEEIYPLYYSVLAQKLW